MQIDDFLLFVTVSLALVLMATFRWMPEPRFTRPEGTTDEDLAEYRAILTRSCGVALLAFLLSLPVAFWVFSHLCAGLRGWLERDGSVVFFLAPDIAQAGAIGLAATFGVLGAVDWFLHRADPGQRAAASRVARVRGHSVLWIFPTTSLFYVAMMLGVGAIGLSIQARFGPEAFHLRQHWFPGVRAPSMLVLPYDRITHIGRIEPGGSLGKSANRSRVPDYWFRGHGTVNGEPQGIFYPSWQLDVRTARFQKAWKRLREVTGLEVLVVAEGEQVPFPWKTQAP